MTTRTPRPVSDNSLPEAPSPFCGGQDEEPNPLLAEYEQLCPDGLDEGAIEAVAKRAPPIKYLLDDKNQFRKKHIS